MQTVKDPNIPLTVATSWPAHGARIPLQSFKGESPDPRSQLRAAVPTPWQGLPLLGFFSSSAEGATMYLAGPQGRVPVCIVTEKNYWHPDPGSMDVGRSILASRNAMIGIPQPVLVPGVYHMVLQNGAGEVLNAWFEILPERS